jgi:hypothetical protein
MTTLKFKHYSEGQALPINFVKNADREDLEKMLNAKLSSLIDKINGANGYIEIHYTTKTIPTKNPTDMIHHHYYFNLKNFPKELNQTVAELLNNPMPQ